MNFYIGIDLGGTNIKAGVVDQEGMICGESSLPTNLPRPAAKVAEDIARTALHAVENAGLSATDIRALGLGCPGTVDPKTGEVLYSNNLGWHHFQLGAYLHDRLGMPVFAGNDANVAALGEVCAGSAKGAQSAVIITLGTGVGAGIVLNGRIWSGCNGSASEFGHMVIEHGGYPCTCGRLGCFESYASATGLIRMTRDAIQAHPDSLLHQIAGPGGPDGRTAFEAMKQGDPIGRTVATRYIEYLACGITNIINALQPEVISLGGGVANQGETLLEPLRSLVYDQVFGGQSEVYTRLVNCTLGYKAGLIGAAMLSAQSLTH